MLSIQPLKSAKGATDYYTAAFNYYAGDAQALRWLGRGAEMLNLKGLVEKEQMLSLMEGKLPNGQILQNKKGEHRPGFDMTFSAPKTVSILAGLRADLNLEKLHDQAVEKAVSRIEQEFAQARVVIDGKVHYVNTGNLVIAAFRQPSSRANDPALHTHCVTMNITFTEADGKARSLASDIHGEQGVIEQLQRKITYAGLIYRIELANLLKEEGYQLTQAGEGLFEIASIPSPVLKEFSQRRAQVESQMEDAGWEGARLASRATLMTRNQKEEHDIEVLFEDWKSRCEALEFDPVAFVESVKSKAAQPASFWEGLKDKIFNRFFAKEEAEVVSAREAVFVATEVAAQKESVFEVKTLKELAMRHVLTGSKVVSIEAIDQEIKTQIEQKTLYEAIDPLSQKKMLTTPWGLTLEAETLARIEQNKDQITPIMSVNAIIKAQNEYDANSAHPLTPSQRNALTSLLSSPDRFNAIQGFAGTGKTTLLKLASRLSEEKGIVFRGMAISSSAVNELRSKAGIHADVFPIVYEELKRAKNNSLKNTAYILDEASMLSTIQGHELLKLVEQKGARLFLTGDDAQLPSVKAGRIFGLAQEYGIRTTKMTDIIRQKSQLARESVEDAIHGDLHDSLAKISEVREFSSHDERVSHMAKLWLNLSAHARDHTLLFAQSHKNRLEITDLIRQGLKKAGELENEGKTLDTLKAKMKEEIEFYSPQYYQSGDVLLFNINLPNSRIKRGDYLTVGELTEKHLKNKTVPLSNAQGKSFKLNLKDLPAYKPTQAGLNRPIECYEKTTIELCINDKILITRNNNKKKLYNSTTGRITGIDAQGLFLKLDGIEEPHRIGFESAASKHLDYGYVLTNMKVQGKDETYGIGLMESYNWFSANIKNYYVQISRATRQMTLITDDKIALLKALEINDADKKSALESLSHQALLDHQKRFVGNSKAIDINALASMRETREATFSKNQAIIDQYRLAKQSNKTSIASKYAFEIASTPLLQRMCRMQLGLSDSVLKKDALKLQTLRLMKSLSNTQKQEFLTVKNYVKASLDAKKAWKVSRNQHATRQMTEAAIRFNLKRDELAYAISANLENYKPYLKHFSIGQLNRLAVPQHRIGQGELRAVERLKQLAQHAEKQQFRSLVAQFFGERSLAKDSLAFHLKEQSKRLHKELIIYSQKTQVPMSVLWGQINEAALRHREIELKKSLSIKEQQDFELLKQYKARNKELALSFAANAYELNRDGVLPDDIEKLQRDCIKLRNQIAGQLQASPLSSQLICHFKVDLEKLSKQASQDEKRKTVELFQNPYADFASKGRAAALISQDIKSHYPYIKELNVNLDKLNAFIRIQARQIIAEDLSTPEKKGLYEVVGYKSASLKASKLWKTYFSELEQGLSPNASILGKAELLTAKRDWLAHKIAKRDDLISFIESEKLDINKINQQAKNHSARVKTINRLNHQKETLLKILSKEEIQTNQNLSPAWFKDWDAFKRGIDKVHANKALYSQVISDSPNPWSFTKEQEDLISRYELKSPDSTRIKADAMTTQTKRFKEVLNADDIVAALMANPEESYRAIFGEPKRINAREMRYSGGLIVSLKGKKAGFWYDFGEGQGGNPLQALMRERGLDFKEALVEASHITGGGITRIEVKHSARASALNAETIDKNKIKSAQSIINGTIGIKDTPAEKYLKIHRGIEHPERLNLRFWPKGAAWLATDDDGALYQKINKIPALIIAAKNEKGEVTGVQRIYLDERSCKKNSFMECAKLSKGKIEGSAGLIQRGDKLGRLYITEGPETAASIAMADPHATVLASFGISNIKNLDKVIKAHHPQTVIIAGDNDGKGASNTLKMTHEAVEHLTKLGHDVRLIIPKELPGRDKTDWNDVHKIEGIQSVQRQLGLTNEIKSNSEHKVLAVPPNTLNLVKPYQQEVAKRNQDLAVHFAKAKALEIPARAYDKSHDNLSNSGPIKTTINKNNNRQKDFEMEL